jgi:hypothetical protein
MLLSVRRATRSAKAGRPILVGGGVTLVHEPEFELWLEWEAIESSDVFAPWDNDDPEDDWFIMQVRLPDGRYYALNVWTYGSLERAHQADVKTGDNLGGAYLLPPDLFVARRDRTLLEGVVRDILRTGVPETWQLLEADEDTE